VKVIIAKAFCIDIKQTAIITITSLLLQTQNPTTRRRRWPGRKKVLAVSKKQELYFKMCVYSDCYIRC